MNKILITLLMFLSANAFATDNYNAASNVLTIPSVIVGSNTFNNVVVQMGNFSVLSYSPNPSIGTVLYDDATINVTLTGSSRETPTATGSRGVLFFTADYQQDRFRNINSAGRFLLINFDR